MTPIADLPDEVLLFLVSSRYCDSDNLADFAWSKFGTISGGYRRAQAICDFVHSKIRFSYPDARSTRSASDALREGVGVCRDFAHLAVALCRCMNVPARYCTGYLGDIGVPIDVNPMDFSAWFEVFLDGRWWTMDARHNHPRIGRIVMCRGRDAADVAISTAFGDANLKRFEVMTDEKVEGGEGAFAPRRRRHRERQRSDRDAEARRERNWIATSPLSKVRGPRDDAPRPPHQGPGVACDDGVVYFSAQPPRDPLIHVAPAQEVEVPGLAGDPLPVGREIQIARGLLVAAERARDGDEAVAEQAVLEVAGRGGGGGGDRVAGDPVRQRNGAARIGLAGEAVAALPVLVQQARRSGGR